METIFNNIEIPIVSDTTYTLKNSGYPAIGAPPFGFIWSSPGIYGGGDNNVPNVNNVTGGTCGTGNYTWGWPEDCCGSLCLDGSGSYDEFKLGEVRPTGTIWVEDVKTGADKTAYYTALAGWNGWKFNVWVDATGSIEKWYTYSQYPGNWNIGDVIHIPGGTLVTDAWNPNFGTGDCSLDINIVMQSDWLIEHYDTSPLVIPIDKIITVIPDTTTTVKIVTSIPSAKNARQSIFTITNDIAAPTAMSLVHCINRAIRHGGQRPGTNTLVDWNYSNTPNIVSLEYNLDLNATP